MAIMSNRKKYRRLGEKKAAWHSHLHGHMGWLEHLQMPKCQPSVATKQTTERPPKYSAYSNFFNHCIVLARLQELRNLKFGNSLVSVHCRHILWLQTAAIHDSVLTLYSSNTEYRLMIYFTKTTLTGGVTVGAISGHRYRLSISCLTRAARGTWGSAL